MGRPSSPLLLPLLLAAASRRALAAGGVCPGSPSWVHASTRVEVIAKTDCKTVMDEMLARVHGQFKQWHDPHNNGTYKLLSSQADSLIFSRMTGNGKYTDKMGFGFHQQDLGQCSISGCSESQVFSIADFSTNYCNLRNLYCGSEEGCKPVQHDFAIQEVSVDPSKGAGKTASDCIVKQEAAAEMHFLGTSKESESDTAAALSCINEHCPVDPETLSPSFTCVLKSCGKKVGKCLLKSDCRRVLMCEKKCVAPLKKTDAAPVFLALAQCHQEHCPEDPPFGMCAKMHCRVEAEECAVEKACYPALDCVNGCIPKGAELTAVLLQQPINV
mmetsp:Transcript_92262/g.232025  ORF Transcript_92262/g.232025 Transcript_92262/m.232025 type:complete len:329 (-) Transcript_92262:197-1183(-)